MKILLKKGIRILMPKECDVLLQVISDKYKPIFLTALYTGMRYEELRRFQKHPEWLLESRHCIHLPKEAVRKKKVIEKERYVFFSEALTPVILELFFKTRTLPSHTQWNANIKMWGRKSGLSDKGLSAKTTRKTWESWLVVSFDNKIPLICMSQGHTTTVSMEHYLQTPFLKEERDDIKERTKGWNWN